MDVHSRRVIGSCTDRRTQDDLVAFTEQVAQVYPKDPVHIVWDNLNTHRAQAVRDDFNARHHQRFVFHFTPLHASRVNQIELLFGIYSRRVLRHASHASIDHLRQRTEVFMAQCNRAPKPFKWTFAGFELQTGEPLRFKDNANVRRPKKSRRVAARTRQVDAADRDRTQLLRVSVPQPHRTLGAAARNGRSLRNYGLGR
jgi:transposase